MQKGKIRADDIFICLLSFSPPPNPREQTLHSQSSVCPIVSSTCLTHGHVDVEEIFKYFKMAGGGKNGRCV